MIKKLRAKNYKSLKDLDIELRQFNVLIGPNAAGKSTIIDVLAFLRELVETAPYGHTLRPRGGFGKVAFGGTAREIEVSFESFLDSLQYAYALAFDSTHITNQQATISGVVAETNDRGDLTLEGSPVGGSRDASIFQRILHYPQQWPISHQVYKFLKSFRFYHIIPSEIRKVLPVLGTIELDRNGGNLAQVLHTLHNDHEEIFGHIEFLVKQALPEVERVRTPLVQGRNETYVALKETTGLEADFHQLSDGTLKLLAFITAVSLPEPQVICFEEPENFVHARLQNFLVEVLKNSVKQIILSTHHPYFVDFVEPQDVIIVEKEEGKTKVSRVENSDELKQRLENLELGLGEYYYSGALGGTP